MQFKILKNGNSVNIIDGVTDFPILKDRLSVSYTLKTDDITVGKRLETENTTPYDSRTEQINLTGYEKINTQGYESFSFTSNDNLTRLLLKNSDEVLYLDLKTARQDFSEFGLNLPFNFMGKINGGGYQNQFLFNSPYRSLDNSIKFCYLSNLNGRNLCVLFLSEADGWKMDYSKYLGGHYFYNLKCLANFDKAFGVFSNNLQISLAMFFVNDFKDCLQKVSTMLNLPFLYYHKSYTLDGCGELEVIGDCDYVQMNVEGKISKICPVNGKIYFSNAKYKTTFTPFKNGKKGGQCSIYAYNDLRTLWYKANEFVSDYTGEWLPDDNACEGQCFVESLLKYQIRYGKVDKFDKRLKTQFDEVLMQTDVNKASPRATILNLPYQNYPAYHVFKSHRIQEQFFAVSIFLNAYMFYGESKYLTYCINSLNTLIDNYQLENGCLLKPNDKGGEDYSTVCCLIIPIIDVALALKDFDQNLYNKFKLSATKLAEYIYKRGFCFPTEGGETDLAEDEFEDGSISCSALSLLYYSKKIQYKKEYVKMAKDILDLHEAWVMKTPDCSVYNSSLRWWETRWEGDADGPSLCCGHAWTIWRAEADFWYYSITNDSKYLDKALSGFANNFVKFNPISGEGRSVYTMDYITGGGLYEDRSLVKFRVAPQIPDDVDVRLSYYVFNRADVTIFEHLKKQLKL